MVFIRRATVEDLLGVQLCNILVMPENYQLKDYLYHILSWPQLFFLAEDYTGDVVGYVIGKMEDDPRHGHITSLCVLDSFRRLGIATKLMTIVHNAMESIFSAENVSLYVRCSNHAAITFYSSSLGYNINSVEAKYYADGEDAYIMSKRLKSSPHAHGGSCCSGEAMAPGSMGGGTSTPSSSTSALAPASAAEE